MGTVTWRIHQNSQTKHFPHTTAVYTGLDGRCSKTSPAGHSKQYH